MDILEIKSKICRQDSFFQKFDCQFVIFIIQIVKNVGSLKRKKKRCDLSYSIKCLGKRGIIVKVVQKNEAFKTISSQTIIQKSKLKSSKSLI